MRKPTAKTIIRKAYRLLTDENKWIKHAFASRSKTADHNPQFPVGENDKGAHCFCMMGALYRIENEIRSTGFDVFNERAEATRHVRAAVSEATRGSTESIADFNDSPVTRHKDVMHVLRRAYQLAGGSRP